MGLRSATLDGSLLSLSSAPREGGSSSFIRLSPGPLDSQVQDGDFFSFLEHSGEEIEASSTKGLWTPQ